jgi:hypothetical protein
MVLIGESPVFQVFCRAAFKFQFSHQYGSIDTAAVFNHYLFYTCVELFNVYIETSVPYYLRQHPKQLIFFPLKISSLYNNVLCMLSFKYIISNSDLVTFYYAWL